MKTFVLIRFATLPNPAVSIALVPHMSGQGMIYGIPGAVISFIHSESSLEEIDKDLRDVDAGLVDIKYLLFDVSDKHSFAHLLKDQKYEEFINRHRNIDTVPDETPQQLLDRLKNELDEAVRDQNYEAAIQLRNRINQIEKS